IPEWDESIASFLEARAYLHRVADGELREQMDFDTLRELVIARCRRGDGNAIEAAYGQFKDACDRRMQVASTAKERAALEAALIAVKAKLDTCP
ncbi:hypothetical protein HN937_28190, partial [Candidatus Poribacteria bacterium]|nr:hypothetical protein [Candidatus Poribacteria bacterium]